MNSLECKNRRAFIDEISNYILESPSISFQFIGKNGVGKEYVLDNIENKIKRQCEIYRVVSDALIKKDRNVSAYTYSVAFSLGNLLGMSLTSTQNDKLKINYIISNLKTLTPKKILLISALDYDILSAESREFIHILLCNKKVIEEKVKKKIAVIITGNHDYFNGRYKVCNVYFKDYERKDIYNYLIDTCGYVAPRISNENLNQICKLCGTNLDLVKNYAGLILDASNSSSSFESIVDTKLNYYIRSGCKYNLTADDLKSILLASSMSIHLLTPKMISYINCISEPIVEKGFVCAVVENFLEEERSIRIPQTENFLFVSQEEKKYLSSLAGTFYQKKILDYYIYLSKVAEDEYFERSQYLMRYYGCMNKSVFALIILAVSKSFLTNDMLERDNIIHFFYNNNDEEKNKHLFEIIIEAYYQYYQRNYERTVEILDGFDYSEINAVAAAELRRLLFKSGYLGRIMTPQRLNGISKELQMQLSQKLVLTTEFGNGNKDEKLLSLRLIFELAPFVLDYQNDKESFAKLYDDSLVLVNYINENFIKKSFAEYIINIFNRKAFLFAAPSQASVFYEQAVAYFKENKIWDEYVVALASKAGNEISLHRYTKAISSCKTAIEIMEKYDFAIPQKEKIYNNLFVAEFLYFESQEKTIYEMQNEAISVAEKLKKMLTGTSCSIDHVILTNMSALYLYADKEQEYNQSKKRLENSLQCNNVSNLNDLKVNDFYRYHFAWYEFYLYLKHGNWEKCTGIVNSLDSFYPAIFHNQEKMDLRIEAARYLVSEKRIPNIRQYGLNMLQFAPSDRERYTSRGLPLCRSLLLFKMCCINSVSE